PLSQFSPPLHSPQHNPPFLSHLTHTPQIQQHPHFIMLIYPHHYYHNHTHYKHITEIQIPNHRNPPLGIMKFHFFNQF
ncbi:DnaB-like helicase C-terminal domain-containing protein, partial [Bacillus mycoides]|uniref:DnaB-like helicase C-terminal domain-containing protein n=1 Tax=Bacillus mycoides TaxID=1405 RepID=UPI003CC7E1F0